MTDLFTEEEIVDTLFTIVKTSAPILITNLGHALQFKLNTASICVHIREIYGGLLNLLNRHQDKFEVSGNSPKYIVCLVDKQTIEKPVALSKELLIIMKYKTGLCCHFNNGLSCPHSLCNFAHGKNEFRREPFSPFGISYESTLCPDRTPDGNCIHGMNCRQCVNQFEVDFHPENYRHHMCLTSVTRSKCMIYPVCPKAHNSHELKTRIYIENEPIYLARYQSWDRLFERLKFDTVSEIFRNKYMYTGETILHYGAKYCQLDVIEFILANETNDTHDTHDTPIDVNVKDIFGQTPLHKLAAYAGGSYESQWIECLKALVFAGGDLTMKDYDGYDCYILAKKNRCSMIQEPLKHAIKFYEEKYCSLTNKVEPIIAGVANKIAVKKEQKHSNHHPQVKFVPIAQMISNHYVYGDHIRNQNARLIEYKSIRKLHVIEDITSVYLCKNVVAFLNTLLDEETGRIFYGITDDGKVTGVHFRDTDQATVFQAISEQLKRINPPISEVNYHLRCFPIHDTTDNKIPNLYIIEIAIRIEPGSNTIYFSPGNKCWARRINGIVSIVNAQLTDLVLSRTRYTDILNTSKHFSELSVDKLEDIEDALLDMLKVIDTMMTAATLHS